MRQHDFVSIRDVPPAQFYGQFYKGGSLDLALTRFAEEGKKVLNFKRAGSQWIFKVMKP